jgi:anti-sigma factor RsiW
MKCQEATPLAEAYSDGELDVVRSLDLEQHLRDCSACAQSYARIQSLKKVFASADLYHRAPAQLRREVSASLAGKRRAAAPTYSVWWSFLKRAIPALGVALLALILIPSLRGPSAADRLAQEVTSCHIRSLMVEHRTDVTSTDQHTVKPWFQGKLDFSPPVNDFAEQGFPLTGGRLDYLEGRPAAALVYRHREHVINLFVWPADKASVAQRRTRALQGFNLVYWTEHGMNYWAVSDLNQAELWEFCQLSK